LVGLVIDLKIHEAPPEAFDREPSMPVLFDDLDAQRTGV
jgi:hypothetical protein